MKNILYTSFLLVFIALANASLAQTPPVFAEDESFFGPYEVLAETQSVSDHTLEFWKPADKEDYTFGTALRITSPKGKVIELEGAVIDQEVIDLQGDGTDELILSIFSGGAHCCTTTTIYSLDGDLSPIFELPYSECSVFAEDLYNDGSHELLGCDDTWAYAFCSYASSPMPSMVWEWQDDVGSYVVANQQYSSQFAEELGNGFANFLNVEAGTYEAENPECTTLRLALPLLYLGETETAHKVVTEYYQAIPLENTYAENYQFANAEEFWQAILETAKTSPLYEEVVSNNAYSE